MIDLLELYHTADAEGVIVDCFPLDNRDALSLMDTDGACSIAIDPFKLVSTKDEKIKLAHELGHCITGSFYNRYAKADIRARHERRADKWAIKKLIPKDELIEKLSEGYIEPWELAEQFDVTVPFMAMAMEYYQVRNLIVPEPPKGQAE